MAALLPWPGGKAKLAHEVASILLPHVPKNGTFYEGFGGACNVSVVIGMTRPDIHLIITETNPKMVAALLEIKKVHPAEMAARILWEMDYLLAKPESLWDCKDSDDPAEWIAGLNCRYPGELNSWNMNPDRKRHFSRRRAILPGLIRYHEALRNATILNEPAGCRLANAAYFDPPYFNSKPGMYPHAEGSTLGYGCLFRKQRKYSRAILISDFLDASKHYIGFTGRPVGRALSAFATDKQDAYFSWTDHPGCEFKEDRSSGMVPDGTGSVPATDEQVVRGEGIQPVAETGPEQADD